MILNITKAESEWKRPQSDLRLHFGVINKFLQFPIDGLTVVEQSQQILMINHRN